MKTFLDFNYKNQCNTSEKTDSVMSDDFASDQDDNEKNLLGGNHNTNMQRTNAKIWQD